MDRINEVAVLLRDHDHDPECEIDPDGNFFIVQLYIKMFIYYFSVFIQRS